MNISVAMCTYNGSRFLEEQLLSIGAQTLLPCELVICDDGSTDATEAIVESFRMTAGFPVHFHRNVTNLGSTKNFEHAITLCTGEAIALCDQDDRWFPDKLRVMAATLEARPDLAGVFSNAKLMDDEGKFLEEDLWKRAGFTAKRQQSFSKSDAPFQLISRDTVTGAAFVFRASFANKFMPISKMWVHDGWIALILAAVAEIQPIPEHLMAYRLHTHQQVGVRQVPWHAHLSTQKADALAAHRNLGDRMAAMAARLETLGVNPAIIAVLNRKTAFLTKRIGVLSRPRITRPLPALNMLPDYIRYQNGVMSLLRDLLH